MEGKVLPCDGDCMSFVRWGVAGSDVYLFHHVDGFLCCYMCDLASKEDAEIHSWDQAKAHLEMHRAAGHCVPHFVDAEIEREFVSGRMRRPYRPPERTK